MSAGAQRSAALAPARSGGGRFRRRPVSRGDAARTPCAGRSQNRQLMRGGRA